MFVDRLLCKEEKEKAVHTPKGCKSACHTNACIVDMVAVNAWRGFKKIYSREILPAKIFKRTESYSNDFISLKGEDGFLARYYRNKTHHLTTYCAP